MGKRQDKKKANQNNRGFVQNGTIKTTLNEDTQRLIVHFQELGDEDRVENENWEQFVRTGDSNDETDTATGENDENNEDTATQPEDGKSAEQKPDNVMDDLNTEDILTVARKMLKEIIKPDLDSKPEVKAALAMLMDSPAGINMIDQITDQMFKHLESEGLIENLGGGFIIGEGRIMKDQFNISKEEIRDMTVECLREVLGSDNTKDHVSDSDEHIPNNDNQLAVLYDNNPVVIEVLDVTEPERENGSVATMVRAVSPSSVVIDEVEVTTHQQVPEFNVIDHHARTLREFRSRL